MDVQAQPLPFPPIPSNNNNLSTHPPTVTPNRRRAALVHAGDGRHHDGLRRREVNAPQLLHRFGQARVAFGGRVHGWGEGAGELGPGGCCEVWRWRLVAHLIFPTCECVSSCIRMCVSLHPHTCMCVHSNKHTHPRMCCCCCCCCMKRTQATHAGWGCRSPRS
jgi:hypothetical protein